MGRRAATVEYLERLIVWAGGRKQFLLATGIRGPNLTAYLNGSKNIGWKRLQTATQEVFGVPPAFIPVVEGFNLTEASPTVADLSHEPGVYALFDSAMRLLYFGKATDLYAETHQTLRRSAPEVRPWTGARNLTFRTIFSNLPIGLSHRAWRRCLPPRRGGAWGSDSS